MMMNSQGGIPQLISGKAGMASATQKTGSTNLHSNQEDSNRPKTSGTQFFINNYCRSGDPGATLDAGGDFSSNGGDDIKSAAHAVNHNVHATQPITMRGMNSPQASKSGAVHGPKSFKSSSAMPGHQNNRRRKQA